jgi:LmbE family N-acetylglucosaminyl deacetylase
MNQNSLFPLRSTTHTGLRLQVVVAHPDDETFGCGSLLLHAAAAGAVTAVCCGTRGEAGEWPEEMVLPPGGIAEQRERELRAAAAALGVCRPSPPTSSSPSTAATATGTMPASAT